MEGRIFRVEVSDWAGRCVLGLEADRYPIQPCAPDPATTVLIMLDIDSGRPTWADSLLLVLWMIRYHVFCCWTLNRAVGCEQVVLQHIGQAGDPDAKQPDTAGGVHRRQQRGGNRANDIGSIRRVQQCA